MLLCLHEEHAVAHRARLREGDRAADGGRRALNVGLMHASMAIFNAFCDRVPMLVVGATGPLDAAERRPWIDWLHTATDQAALVRAVPQVGRPARVGRRLPCSRSPAPHLLSTTRAVRPCLPLPRRRDPGGTAGRARGASAAGALQAPAPPPCRPGPRRGACERLAGAHNLVLLAGRGSRDETAWRATDRAR